MVLHAKADDIIRSEMSATTLKIATENLDKAARKFNEAEMKCNKLRKFRQDYVDRFNNEIKPRSDEYVQQSFASFFAKLDFVIHGQQEQVETLGQEFQTQYKIWQECQRKHKAMQQKLEQSEELELVA